MPNTYNMNELPAKAFLKFVSGPRIGEVLPLRKERVNIGRITASDVFVNDLNVSRTHCELKFTNGAWDIVDSGGINGTYVDGVKIPAHHPRTPLNSGNIIHLGPPEGCPTAFLFQVPQYQSPSQSSTSAGASVTTFMQDSSSILREQNNNRQEEARSEYFRTAENNEDSDATDCSMCSTDSLKTRIRKLSSKKKRLKSGKLKSISNAAACSTASPLFRPTKTLECIIGNSDKKRQKRLDIAEPSSFSQVANGKDESDSESLLNRCDDDVIPFDKDSFPWVMPKREGEDSEPVTREETLARELIRVTCKLKKVSTKKKELKTTLKELTTSYTSFQDTFKKLLEDELMCNICTEIYIQPLTLNCSHTFCEHCISEWKKKQKRCPICREKITSETKILFMNSFISKAVEHLDEEHKSRWKELVTTREAAKVSQAKPRNKRRRVNRSRSAAPQAAPLPLVAEPADLRINVAPARPYRPAEMDLLFLSEASSSNSSHDDGEGYYGGYGECYHCGYSGHWRNNCPFLFA